MKKIFIISVLFLCSCSDHRIPINDLIKPYMEEGIFNVEQFTKENKDYDRIVIIRNSIDSLEFFLFSDKNDAVLYYKNGREQHYIHYARCR